MLLNPYRFATSGGSTPILDTYGSATCAYSVRKLKTGATLAFKVRRSSDNTTQDIGFTAGGDLDSSALTTFVGANNGFIDTWYDQSGNGLNLTQSTQANQAQIVSSGSIITNNSKPTPLYDGSNDGYASAFSITALDSANAITIAVVEKSANTSQNTGSFITLGRSATQDYTSGFVFERRTNNLGITAGIGSGGTASTSFRLLTCADSNTSALSQLFAVGAASGGVATIAVEQSNKTLTLAAGTMAMTSFQSAGSGSHRAMLGCRANNTGNTLDNFFSGHMPEVIVWCLDQTASLSGISNNQKTYFGTP